MEVQEARRAVGTGSRITVRRGSRTTHCAATAPVDAAKHGDARMVHWTGPMIETTSGSSKVDRTEDTGGATEDNSSSVAAIFDNIDIDWDTFTAPMRDNSSSVAAAVPVAEDMISTAVTKAQAGAAVAAAVAKAQSAVASAQTAAADSANNMLDVAKAALAADAAAVVEAADRAAVQSTAGTHAATDGHCSSPKPSIRPIQARASSRVWGVLGAIGLVLWAVLAAVVLQDALPASRAHPVDESS